MFDRSFKNTPKVILYNSQSIRRVIKMNAIVETPKTKP